MTTVASPRNDGVTTNLPRNISTAAAIAKQIKRTRNSNPKSSKTVHLSKETKTQRTVTSTPSLAGNSVLAKENEHLQLSVMNRPVSPKLKKHIESIKGRRVSTRELIIKYMQQKHAPRPPPKKEDNDGKYNFHIRKTTYGNVAQQARIQRAFDLYLNRTPRQTPGTPDFDAS